jgi:dTDP-4-amino-4,6-dideoxygalactose transaminase
MIQILDLVPQYQTLKADIDAAIHNVLENGNFIMGPNVGAFEQEIAAYLGADHTVALNSGTDALHLALRALDVGPGDEVITSPFTFIATGEAIGLVGATPVFVDIEPSTFNIDSSLIERAITPRTRAILPIHLYGKPADMRTIMGIARERRIPVIEDCAQAIGAHIDGRKAGTIGDVGCFSFFPSKNLGAYGDGGLITTSDARLAERVRMLRVHGAKQKYYHQELGINSRLDEIQAAILRIKLPHLDAWNAKRRDIALRYTAALKHAVIQTPEEGLSEQHVYHQYTVRVHDRDQVQRKLRDAGIQTMIYYPVPLHEQSVYSSLQLRPNSLPHSEQASREVLSLPIYPELALSDQERVIETLLHATKAHSFA